MKWRQEQPCKHGKAAQRCATSKKSEKEEGGGEIGCDGCLRARPQRHHTNLSGAEVALSHVHGDKRQHKDQHATHDGQNNRNQRNNGFYSVNFMARCWSRCGCGHGRFLLGFNGFARDFTYTQRLAQLRIKTGQPQDLQHLLHMGVTPGLNHQFDLGVLC